MNHNSEFRKLSAQLELLDDKRAKARQLAAPLIEELAIARNQASLANGAKNYIQFSNAVSLIKARLAPINLEIASIGQEIGKIKNEIKQLNRKNSLARIEMEGEFWFWEVLKKGLRERLATGELVFTADESDAFDHIQDNIATVFQSGETTKKPKKPRLNADSVSVIESFKGKVK